MHARMCAWGEERVKETLTAGPATFPTADVCVLFIFFLKMKVDILFHSFFLLRLLSTSSVDEVNRRFLVKKNLLLSLLRLR
ncbi:hypothetical protein CSUI_009494 [Cystoisospora suis]|uniref:Uncharacterized protein n=1 Tax=Cystoisospora suis TaxID=483139 RepID=A0A2C6K373_9APIC|nr:hypothetical protein CSUI_009494 [Cystoisospora suis]